MRKNKILSIILILIIICVPSFVFARYYEFAGSIKVSSEIAKPIIHVDSLQPQITQEINKKTPSLEYSFVVKNYELEDDEISKKKSEIDFYYTIQIVNSDNHFPIRYELYDMDGNLQLLDISNKTAPIYIEKNVEYEKKYKLVVTWEQAEEPLSDLDEIGIIVQVLQNNS